jgi:hypothetical protein
MVSVKCLACQKWKEKISWPLTGIGKDDLLTKQRIVVGGVESETRVHVKTEAHIGRMCLSYLSVRPSHY